MKNLNGFKQDLVSFSLHFDHLAMGFTNLRGGSLCCCFFNNQQPVCEVIAVIGHYNHGSPLRSEDVSGASGVIATQTPDTQICPHTRQATAAVGFTLLFFLGWHF